MDHLLEKCVVSVAVTGRGREELRCVAVVPASWMQDVVQLSDKQRIDANSIIYILHIYIYYIYIIYIYIIASKVAAQVWNGSLTCQLGE